MAVQPMDPQDGLPGNKRPCWHGQCESEVMLTEIGWLHETSHGSSSGSHVPGPRLLPSYLCPDDLPHEAHIVQGDSPYKCVGWDTSW